MAWRGEGGGERQKKTARRRASKSTAKRRCEGVRGKGAHTRVSGGSQVGQRVRCSAGKGGGRRRPCFRGCTTATSPHSARSNQPLHRRPKSRQPRVNQYVVSLWHLLAGSSLRFPRPRFGASPSRTSARTPTAPLSAPDGRLLPPRPTLPSTPSPPPPPCGPLPLFSAVNLHGRRQARLRAVRTRLHAEPTSS